MVIAFDTPDLVYQEAGRWTRFCEHLTSGSSLGHGGVPRGPCVLTALYIVPALGKAAKRPKGPILRDGLGFFLLGNGLRR